MRRLTPADDLLIYVAIIEDPSRSAEVRVILAGRTACGELVFIESVSIET